MAMNNRLAGELSPYLLQHAGNPVDWHPWGPGAFELARALDKPLFLSIGYATCHWCHVMEREAFENPECARLLNAACVPVKVDREERPDLDAVYMTAAQALGNEGGWPLNLLLTPRGLPFFAATYLPPDSAFGRMGLKDLCRRVSELWRERRADLEEEAETLARRLRSLEIGETGPIPGPELLQAAHSELAARFDPVHGGFGNAPKFPSPHTLLFLLRHGSRRNEPRAVDMAAATLRAMRRGGIFDQAGFGFHRYSTDRLWLLPHFEKMLYDQALLALAYAEGFRVTGAGDLADTAGEVLTYVLRDLAGPEGGFCTAEDADAQGIEGSFYVFTLEEFLHLAEEALPGRGPLLARVFGLRAEGNFHDEATGRATGANVLHLPRALEEAAGDEGLESRELAGMIETLRPALLAARGRRPRPFRDDKVLTDWNGLMVAALAACGRILEEPRLVEEAERAATFLRGNLRGLDGRLVHRWRLGRAGLPAHLDDHAFLAWGLLELERVRPGLGWADWALELVETLRRQFRHPEGGFFLTPAAPEDGLALPFRPREAQDGALPSGNSVALHMLLRLARVFGRPDLEDEARALLAGLSARARRFPAAHTHFLSGLGLFLDPDWEG